MPKGLERVQRRFRTNEPCTMDEHSGSAAYPRTKSGPKDIRDQLFDSSSARSGCSYFGVDCLDFRLAA